MFQLIYKYILITSCQTNKQIKTGGKNNSRVAIEWTLFCLSCDAKNCKHYTFAFNIYESLVNHSRNYALSVTGLNGPCVRVKVECTKLPVVNYTHESLTRDHAQGWCWH